MLTRIRTRTTEATRNERGRPSARGLCPVVLGPPAWCRAVLRAGSRCGPAASGGPLRVRRVGGATASPSAVGSPTSRHYAPLHAGPTYEPPTRPPSGRPLRTRLAVSDVASAPCVGGVVVDESQDQERLRRAGSESRGERCPAAVPGCGGVRSGAPFAWHRRQPEFRRELNRRQLPRMQDFTFAGCPPDRTLVGLRLPGEGSTRPRRESGRCASGPVRHHRPAHGKRSPPHTDPKQKITVPSRGEILQRTSGAPRPGLGPTRASRGYFTSSSRAQPPGGPMRNSASEGPSGTARSQPLPLRGNFTSNAHLHEHSLDQRLAGTTGSRSGSRPGNAGGRRSVDQIGGVIRTGRSR